MPSRSASIVLRCSIHCSSISSRKKWRAKNSRPGSDSSFSRASMTVSTSSHSDFVERLALHHLRLVDGGVEVEPLLERLRAPRGPSPRRGRSAGSARRRSPCSISSRQVERRSRCWISDEPTSSASRSSVPRPILEDPRRARGRRRTAGRSAERRKRRLQRRSCTIVSRRARSDRQRAPRSATSHMRREHRAHGLRQARRRCACPTPSGTGMSAAVLPFFFSSSVGSGA